MHSQVGVLQISEAPLLHKFFIILHNQPVLKRIMNQTTQDVIEFLNCPDLDFGGNATAAELLANPQLLYQRVCDLLEAFPTCLTSREAGENLRARIDEADWSSIAEEFQTRLKMASRFFDRDIGGAAESLAV